MSKKTLNPLTKTLKVTDRQLSIIRNALELYDRLLIGQIETQLWNLYIFNRDLNHEEFSDACTRLKQIVFPELHRNESYAVGWKEGNVQQNNSQIAYEIEAMIRHLEWKLKEDAPRYVTSANPPLHYSTESFIEMEVITPDE